MIFLAFFVVAVAIGLSIYAYRNMNYDKSVPRMIEAAGFVEKQANLPDGTVINYGEGSDGGIPLLLIHGQMVYWEDYAKVLSKLSEYYHVYAIDCHGHGESSKNPEKYTAEAMGNDFIWFIENIIGEPAVISGHSSGGLLSAWLAANSPANVKGIVIEDAPFFSTELGRREKTYSWLDGFQTIHEYLNQSEETNYTRFYLERSYMRNFWGNGWEKIVIPGVEGYMEKHSGEVPRLWYLPPSMNRAFDLTGCVQNNNGLYDLRFGNSFYDGSWFENFNQEETLKRIQCPSVLLHTASSYDDNGVLLAAMDADDAKRASRLIPGNLLIDNIKTGHDIHYEKPSFFVEVMIDFLNQID
jgi:pimeloyl-ACP methyl ester carboxylesterase